MRILLNNTYYKKRSGNGYRLQHVFLLLLLIIAVLLSGCSQAVPENAERIGRPANQDIPISGTWVLESCILDGLTEMSDENDPLIGNLVGFSQNTMLYAGEIYRDISYKIKRVNIYEYFLHKNTDMPELLNNSDDEILVVNVYSSDSFLFEFIKDTQGAIIAVMEDRYYNMRKLSDELNVVQETMKEEAESEGFDEDVAMKQPQRSGILLGVRIPVKTEDGLGDYKYGTYWISSENSKLRPVLYANDIYLPRMDGFWKLMVEKKTGPAGIEDSLYAYKVTGGDSRLPGALFENASRRVETRLRKAIVYVGNDYACVENTVYAADSGSLGAAGTEKMLRTLPVDNLSSVDGIKISDMAGENGTMAMENAIAEVLKNSGYEGIIIIDEESRQRNFALYRKTGHWFFKGRIDPDQQGQLPYMDFSLNLLPPSNMVAYDVLHIPWTEMKDKLPNATDIYTSPNKDLAVILIRNDIFLYAIEGRKLSDEPLARIRMEEGSTVIMAEWGMGDYIASWEKSFTKNNEYRTVANELEPIVDNDAVDAVGAMDAVDVVGAVDAVGVVGAVDVPASIVGSASSGSVQSETASSGAASSRSVQSETASSGDTSPRDTSPKAATE